MSRPDLIGYNTLVEDGLRSVVREALRRVAEEGWPGTHHAYITFKTAWRPGLRSRPRPGEVPDFLHTRYPDELTIVLQHQFWGLEVEDDSFSVTLSFNKVGPSVDSQSSQRAVASGCSCSWLFANHREYPFPA